MRRGSSAASTFCAHVASSDLQEGASWRHAVQQELFYIIWCLYAAPCMHKDAQGFCVLQMKPSLF